MEQPRSQYCKPIPDYVRKRRVTQRPKKLADYMDLKEYYLDPVKKPRVNGEGTQSRREEEEEAAMPTSAAALPSKGKAASANTCLADDHEGFETCNKLQDLISSNSSKLSSMAKHWWEAKLAAEEENKSLRIEVAQQQAVIEDLKQERAKDREDNSRLNTEVESLKKQLDLARFNLVKETKELEEWVETLKLRVERIKTDTIKKEAEKEEEIQKMKMDNEIAMEKAKDKINRLEERLSVGDKMTTKAVNLLRERCDNEKKMHSEFAALLETYNEKVISQTDGNSTDKPES